MLVFLSLIKPCKIYGLRHGEGEGVTLAEGDLHFHVWSRESKQEIRERETRRERERGGKRERERDSSLIPPKTTRYRRRMKARDMSQGFR